MGRKRRPFRTLPARSNETDTLPPPTDQRKRSDSPTSTAPIYYPTVRAADKTAETGSVNFRTFTHTETTYHGYSRTPHLLPLLSGKRRDHSFRRNHARLQSCRQDVRHDGHDSCRPRDAQMRPVARTRPAGRVPRHRRGLPHEQETLELRPARRRPARGLYPEDGTRLLPAGHRRACPASQENG